MADPLIHLHERVARNETRIEALEKKQDEIYTDVKHIRGMMDTAKGGWKMFVVIGGACAAAGASIVKLLEWAKVIR